MQNLQNQYSARKDCLSPEIILTIILVVLFLSPQTAIGDVCDFSHLAQEMALLSEYTIEVTEKVKADANSWRLMEKALPNVQRVYGSKDPYFVVLLGWAESWDNLEKFTREQIQAHFSEIAAIAKANARRQEQDYQFSFSHDDPLTMYVTLSYVDGGNRYKDVGMDVVATQSCVVSIKVSGRTSEIAPKYWQAFEEQMALARIRIRDRYGILKFSSRGSRIWWSAFGNMLFWLLIIGVSSWMLSVTYRTKFILVPGSLTRKYSAFIMTVATIMVVVTISYYELFAVQRGQLRYESIPHYALLFLAHLWAYKTNKPKIVTFALMLVVVSIVTGLVFWLLSWSVLTTTSWMGIGIGAALVSYTLVRSSSVKSRREADSTSSL